MAARCDPCLPRQHAPSIFLHVQILLHPPFVKKGIEMRGEDFLVSIWRAAEKMQDLSYKEGGIRERILFVSSSDFVGRAYL
jgi:hypothetical protein